MARSLIERLQEHARRHPSKVALRFLGDRDEETRCLHYAELDQRARALALQLLGLGGRGRRALLVHPPGLDYVVGLFACFYAGITAVPAYPPRSNHPMLRLRSIVADAKPDFVLATAASLNRVKRQAASEPLLAPLTWLATDATEPALEGGSLPDDESNSLALLQYTSGSTSDPKGVMLSQQHFLYNIAALAERCELGEDDRIVSWLPPYHDMGLLGGILFPVCTGTEATLMSPASFLQQPLRWLSAISKYRGTISGGPNFAYELCVRRVSQAAREKLDLASWRIAFSGAERVRAETLDRFAEAFTRSGFERRAFLPCYGLAEATLGVTFGPAGRGPSTRSFDSAELGQNRARESAAPSPAARPLVGVGAPLPACEIAIVDPEAGRPLEPGLVGEIWVRGPGVATGYYERPELTERTFRARLSGQPLDAPPYLRTGDLGFVHERELFITGRCKDLILLRGVNYYPEDIEATVDGCHPRLRPAGACAFAVEVDGEERLIVVHEVDSGRALPDAEIAQAIRRAIVDAHELGTYDVVLVAPGDLPKTSSGKLQRGVTRQAYLDGTLAVAARSFDERAAPSDDAPTALVEEIGRAIADVLDVESVTAEEDFFWLGGHSLMATQLVSRLRETLHVEVPVRAVFEAPTANALARRLSTLPREPTAGPVTRIDRSGPLPLSFSQERMWFLHQVEPDGAAYNVAGAVTLDGPLDVEVLRRSFDCMLARHELLRTNYLNIDGQPKLSIAARRSFDLEVDDLRDRPDPEGAARELSSQLANRPFALAKDMLFRAALYRLSATRCVLTISMHHIVTDAWSMGILARELLGAYELLLTGKDLPDLKDQIEYVDYAAWQRREFDGAHLSGDLAYWKAKLAGAPTLELPYDRLAAVRSSRGALERVPLRGELFQSLRELGAEHSATLFMVMLAAFEVVLHRYSGQTDLVVAVPIANRNQFASERFIGTLVNTLVLRTQVDRDLTFLDMLERVKQSALEAYAHQDLPFERLVSELDLDRNTGRSPLIQAMFDFQNAPLPALEVGELSVRPFFISRGATQFDLSVLVLDTDFAKNVGFEYSTDLFTAEAMRRLAAQYTTVLEAVVAAPDLRLSRIALLGDPERARLLELARATSSEEEVTGSVHGRFEARVREAPNATAVIDAEGSFSYRELDQRARELAARLRAAGAGPSARVAVCLERTRQIPAAFLAALKIGAAYVPIDPRYPRARIQGVLEDAAPRVVLTERALDGAFDVPEGALALFLDEAATSSEVLEEDAPSFEPSPALPAYILFTSGSTGRPKGVEVPGGALVNFLESMRREPGLGPADRLLAVTTVSFDISGLELFLPLVCGASVYIAPSDVAADGVRLAALISNFDPTLLQATPATWKLLLEAGWSGSPTLTILCGGEAMPRELANDLASRGRAVYNLYGPTETTIWSTLARVDAGVGPVSIGKPILNTRVYVLDAERQLVPFGAVGEIYIGGHGVANGYFRRPEITAERFFPDPFAGDPSARMYRTGDLGRLRPDGTLECLGRTDHQIKLRGFRIEPAEIETVLKGAPGVRDAVVVAREDRPGEPRLVAYFIASGTPEAKGAELRARVAESLPEYMVPAAFVSLAELPRTPNGKLDRARLPPPKDEDFARASTYVAPREGVEAQIAEMWRDILGIDQPSARESFFSIGGHSLLALRLLSRIRKTLDVEIPIPVLMQGPTIEQLAREVETRRANPTNTRAPSSHRIPSAPVAANRTTESAVDAKTDAEPGLSFLVPLRNGSPQPPLFHIPGAGGDLLGVAGLAEHLGDDLTLYSVQAPGVDGKTRPFATIPEAADAYLGEIRKVQPAGPYYLSGYCGGGVIAFEIAHRLWAVGERVAMLALVDATRPGLRVVLPRWRRWSRYILEHGLRGLWRRARVTLRREWREGWTSAWIALHRAFGRALPPELRGTWLTKAFFRAEAQYRPEVYPGRLIVLRPTETREPDPDLGWRDFAEQGVDVRVIPGDHESLLREPHVTALAAMLRSNVLEARRSSRDR